MYRPADKFSALSGDDEVLIAIEKEQGLLLLIDPDWRNVIRSTDHAYFEELIADLGVRAKQDSDGLFKQLLELNSGPIVTGDTGILENANPRFCERLNRFVLASTGLNASDTGIC